LISKVFPWQQKPLPSSLPEPENASIRSPPPLADRFQRLSITVKSLP